MDGNFYQTPNFNNKEDVNTNMHQTIDLGQQVERNYLEDILNKNRGKVVRVYVTYPESKEKTNQEFSGTIEGSGQGHLILRDPSNGKWYLILLFYLNYIEFDEPIH